MTIVGLIEPSLYMVRFRYELEKKTAKIIQ